MKTKFNCLYFDANQEPHRKQIDAQQVIFKKYSAFSLVVHVDPCAEGFYKVSETITGRCIIGPQLTPEKAIEVCTKFLATITPQQLGERIAFYLLGPGRAEEPKS